MQLNCKDYTPKIDQIHLENLQSDLFFYSVRKGPGQSASFEEKRGGIYGRGLAVTKAGSYQWEASCRYQLACATGSEEI